MARRRKALAGPCWMPWTLIGKTIVTEALNPAHPPEPKPVSRRLVRLMRRPELGAITGTIIVFLAFGITAGNSGLFSMAGIANFLQVSAQLGILAAAVALLMIGGEFDLSLGSMIGFASVTIGLCVTQFGLSIPAAVAIAFVIAIIVGALNGILVVRTRLPSFIVTLAGLFILRGLTLAITRTVTGRTQIPYITDGQEGSFVVWLFGGKFGGPVFAWLAAHGVIAARPDGSAMVQGLSMSILWWVAVTAFATWLLIKT
ncbi:MAG: ABC transporter permease, partial [Mesorhizobium sp.]